MGLLPAGVRAGRRRCRHRPDPEMKIGLIGKTWVNKFNCPSPEAERKQGEAERKAETHRARDPSRCLEMYFIS